MAVLVATIVGTSTSGSFPARFFDMFHPGYIVGQVNRDATQDSGGT